MRWSPFRSRGMRYTQIPDIPLGLVGHDERSEEQGLPRSPCEQSNIRSRRAGGSCFSVCCCVATVVNSIALAVIAVLTIGARWSHGPSGFVGSRTQVWCQSIPVLSNYASRSPNPRSDLRSTLSSPRLMEIYCVAPVLGRVQIKEFTTQYNFTFHASGTDSLFQQRPSPRVEEAWNRISNDHAFSLSSKEVRRLGHDPDATRAIVDSNNQYYGRVDVFHQLHCLNLFRRLAWPQYFGDLRDKPFYHQSGSSFDEHVLHCQYVLYRSIACHADLEVSVFGKRGQNLNEDAGFSLDRKCRDFGSILEWAEQHRI